ncbi:MAG: helix-turn-helix domain-containing protein [Thermomicrobiales bacterium]|nr:helix-turn-helix domain-containing protein [Thermomicrobiales bacterium]
MDITLDDLLALEPRLTVRSKGEALPETPAPRLDAPTSWAVSARATSPYLPSMRGGEIVLVPPRVTAALADELCDLVREAGLRGASALVFTRGDTRVDRCPSLSAGVAFLEWPERLNGDTEAAINRTLTECRGSLYQIGSNLERQLTDFAASRAGLDALVRVVTTVSGIPVEIQDAHSHPIATSRAGAPGQPANGGGDQGEMRVALASGATLVLGPMRPEQRVIGRFLIGRIAAAADAAMRREEAHRPRGARRAELLEALLAGGAGSASERRVAALGLGLDPDSTFSVAILNGMNEASARAVLGGLGDVHPAGDVERDGLWVVEHPRGTGERPSSAALAELRRRWNSAQGDDAATLALSAPSLGLARLHEASEEARFIATLQREGALRRRIAFFDSFADLGSMRLLYQLRDSRELRQFVHDALGALEAGDQRGTLRETVRAFLESAGSHGEAASRLGIHRNTLAYRLRRAGELIGHDVDEPESWLTLHLALRALDVLEASSDTRD